MTNLTHKEMTAHIRKRIKEAGIKARVSMQELCGQKQIDVFVPSYDSEFSAKEIYEIAKIALVNGLTGVKQSEIDPEKESDLTGKKQWSFEFHAGRVWP